MLIRKARVVEDSMKESMKNLSPRDVLEQLLFVIRCQVRSTSAHTSAHIS